MKCTKGHTGFFACERCTAKGEKPDHTMIFPEKGTKRSDDDFRSKKQKEHHEGTSPLKIDMVISFILDFMHLACLGVMKSLLNFWLAKDKFTKLGYKSRQILSTRMANLRNQVTSKFQRKPRSTETYAH